MRRRAQLLHLRRDLVVADIRGNLDTRLRKLDEGLYDAIVLAEAGLVRLGWQDRITQRIPLTIMLPAVGQGALGVEARQSDPHTLAILGRLDDLTSRSAVVAERTLLAALRGGCLAPVGAWGRMEGGQLRLDAVVLSGDGSQRLAAYAVGSVTQAAAVGEEVAQMLLAQGAGQLIANSRSSVTPPNV
jgi:hydroxymethylbilane synthase